MTSILIMMKRKIKSSVLWGALIGALVLELFLHGLQIPDTENNVIGIYTGETLDGKLMEQELQSFDSVFSYCSYEDETALIEAVKKGVVSCGFSFERLAGDKKGKILEYGTPFSGDVYIAEEELYLAYLRVYQDMILQKGLESVLGDLTVSADQIKLRKEMENRLVKVVFTQLTESDGGKSLIRQDKIGYRWGILLFFATAAVLVEVQKCGRGGEEYFWEVRRQKKNKFHKFFYCFLSFLIILGIGWILF